MKLSKIVQPTLLAICMVFSTVAFSTGNLLPTLKRVQQLDFVSIDPATCFDTGCQQVVDSMCLRLVRQDQTGAVVKDLAKAVPSTAAGTIVNNLNGTVTYKFDVQKGYFFSFPSFAQVTGQTVKKTMERAANPVFGGTGSTIGFYMPDIVGIDNVLNGTTTTISGIVVSSDKSKVSITIKQPSGDFLNRMTLPFSCVVPENTPMAELKKPYPTAGAYTILSYPTITPDVQGNTHSGLTLVRHLLYPFWLSSQPVGQFFFVNYKFGVLSLDQYPAVLAGTYDLGGYEDSQLLDLVNNHPNNTKTIATNSISFLSLHENRWPFCDRHLRRAMNFGFDRTSWANFLVGSLAPLVVTPTDTYLPPSIPGANPTNGSVYPLNGTGMASAKAEMDAFFANPSAFCAPPGTWVSGTPIPLKLIISGLSQTSKTNGFEQASRINNIKGTNGVGFNAKVYCGGDTINPMVNSTDACVGKNLNVFFDTLPADYDIASRGWFQDYADPFDFLNSLWADGSPYNYGLYHNNVISPALDAAGFLAPPARFTTYAGLNIDLAQDGAAVALWVPNNIFLFSNRIDRNSIGPYPDIIIREIRLKP